MSKVKESGSVIGPNLISCVSELSLDEYNDVGDCISVATWHANQYCNRFTQPALWFGEFIDVIGYFGWSLYNSRTYKLVYEGFSGRVESAFLQRMISMNGSGMKDAITDTFSDLKSNEPALASFSMESHDGGFFQIVPVTREPQGGLKLHVTSLRLVATENVGNFLFWNWREETAELTDEFAWVTLDKDKLRSRREELDIWRRQIRMDRFQLRKGRI
jgi:hypothetical protein